MDVKCLDGTGNNIQEIARWETYGGNTGTKEQDWENSKVKQDINNTTCKTAQHPDSSAVHGHVM